MAENTDQKNADSGQPNMQQNRLRISISPQQRERVIAKIINTLRSRCIEPGLLDGIETIAREFEEKVYAVASDERDYLRRIVLRMKPDEGCSQRAINSNILNISRTTPTLEKNGLISVPVQSPHSQTSVSRQDVRTEQANVSSSFRPTVTKQQYESWQRDMANQRKVILIPSQPQRSTSQNSGHNEEQLQVQRMSQKKTENYGEEKSSRLVVNSVSDNQLRPTTGTLRLKSVSSEATKTVERHEDAQNWREYIHQRIMMMKKMYQPALSAINVKLYERLKLLETHPNNPTKDEIWKKLMEAKVMVGRMLFSFNIPKEEVMPKHGERLDDWEQFIVSYISKFIQPKTTLPPETHSAPIQPTQETGTHLPSSPIDVGDNCQTQAHDQKNSEVSPIERLLNAVKSISPQALRSAMDDVSSVVRSVDAMESSAPNSTAKGALGRDLRSITGCRLQARNETRTWTLKPSQSDNDLSKRRRIDSPLKLLSEEIRNVNQRLIDIQVHLCDTGSAKTTVKCEYIGVSVDLSFIRSTNPSASSSSLIQPLEILVPSDYPESPPIVLDKLPTQNVDFWDELSDEARVRLDMSLRCLSSPLSVSDIARTWEACTRGVVLEYAQKFGGGTFSSAYGKWDNCLDATS